MYCVVVVAILTSGSVKETAYKTLLRAPYVKISEALYDPYRRVGLAERLSGNTGGGGRETTNLVDALHAHLQI
jgi:hypothetical protein